MPSGTILHQWSNILNATTMQAYMDMTRSRFDDFYAVKVAKTIQPAEQR